jgi:acetyl-CoA C-acetyltransferase
VARAGIDGGLVEEVYMGCANQAGEDNRNVARMGLLLAGLPHSVAGVTFNRLCASGLNAVNQAARAIACGEGDIFVAGGVESMTRAPYSLPKNPIGFGPSGNITAYDTSLGWRYPNPKLEALFPLEAMGETAENIYERSRAGAIAGGEITREEQDRFALQSQQRAIDAINAGRFQREIVPVVVPQGKGAPLLFDTDEYPRARKSADGLVLDTSMEKLAALKPAFRKGGVVTAGNASGLNDGAAALVLMGVSNFSFALLAVVGHSNLGLAAAMGFENIASGLGGVVVVAYFSALCNLQFTASQYALISAATSVVGRLVTGTQAGRLIDQFGYVQFYLLTTAVALPGILLFWYMMRSGLVDRAMGTAGKGDG